MADTPPNASLTGLGKFITFILIAGLIGLGAWLFWNQSKKPDTNTQQNTQKTQAADPGAGTPAAKTEAPDTSSITTVKEYKYVAGEKLPAVKGVSGYKWDAKEKILRFSYNVWSGWLPVIAANRGVKPNPESVFSKKYGFKVEMVLMDDPVAARDAFTAGDIHAMWGTVDMMVLFAPDLMRDARVSPRIIQQIDWSNGGDGIVVRSHIKSVRDLKGKTVALAMNSPSEYYLTSLMISAGMKPVDIKTKFTATAFEAAAAFVSDKSLDACVSWAPDIYKIPERVAGTRILSSTADANKLIADVYALRADFMRDHPEIAEGLVAGIFEGMDMVKKDPSEAIAAMADAFGMKPEDVQGMRNDAHLTNAAENQQFFLNAANPTNFERTWKNASLVYRELGRLGTPVAFDQVMDFSVVKNVVSKGLFKHQADESVKTFAPTSVRKLNAESPILTQTIRINFYPNSSNPFEPAHDEFGNLINGKLYDPNSTGTLEQVARLAGQFARANILIQGHTDASMKGRVPVTAVKELSLERAEAIKRCLIEKYKFESNKFVTEGKGWDEPQDPASPNDHVLNRRVEISVFSPEEK